MISNPAPITPGPTPQMQATEFRQWNWVISWTCEFILWVEFLTNFTSGTWEYGIIGMIFTHHKKRCLLTLAPEEKNEWKKIVNKKKIMMSCPTFEPRTPCSPTKVRQQQRASQWIMRVLHDGVMSCHVSPCIGSDLSSILKFLGREG